MNLFWKKLFGSLESTEKMEQAELDLIAAYKRYTRIAASPELAEYKKLYQIVKSADFIGKKKTLQSRKYRDTEEYQKMKQFKRLDNNASIKRYYEVLSSGALAEFLAFKKTSEYALLSDKKAVSNDERLKKLKSYGRSKDYKLFVRFDNSDAITQYGKLKAEVAREDFVKNNAFWANPERWKTTDEYKTEQAFDALAATDDIKFFEKTDEKSFDVLKMWTLSFDDNFEGNAANAIWQNGFYHKAPLKRIYSFPNEKQAYTENNISVGNSELQIHVKAEQTEGIAWDTKKGFISKDFKFTSGIINAGEAFKQKTGLIRAKIAVKGSRKISHAFWLGAEGKLPLINIFQHTGKKIFVGNYFSTGSSAAKEASSVRGINASKFYIYSLKWTEKELVWYVNNIEVFRTTKNIPNQAMFPAFNSFITEKQKGGEGTFVVDWLRFYTKA